jgi:hypothetical protein
MKFVHAPTAELAALALFALTGAAVLTLAVYCAHDALGKCGGRIVVMPHAVILDLPAWRSLVAETHRIHVEVSRANIEALETRLEATASLGMASLQRVYRLKLRDRDGVLLFDSRMLATPLGDPTDDAVARDVAGAMGVRWVDRGVVKCQGGLFGVGSRAPAWTTPSLPVEEQLRLWRRAYLTGVVASLTTLMFVVLKALTIVL